MSSRGVSNPGPMIRLTPSSKVTTTGPLRADVSQPCVRLRLACDNPWRHMALLALLRFFRSPRKSPPVPGVFLMWGSECGTTSELVPPGGTRSMGVLLCWYWNWGSKGRARGTLAVRLTFDGFTDSNGNIGSMRGFIPLTHGFWSLRDTRCTPRLYSWSRHLAAPHLIETSPPLNVRSQSRSRSQI